ncbi:hypothetical protein R1flu_012943 [Riccia fluitans]|uniref:Uncharacterized protein n=1 Tax=Riccia fluitans TaxID=41844 RepID=A0ABD1ZC78_9MARC
MSQNHTGKEENAMAGRAPTIKKPKKEEVQDKTARPGTSFINPISSRGRGGPGAALNQEDRPELGLFLTDEAIVQSYPSSAPDLIVQAWMSERTWPRQQLEGRRCYID